MFINFVDHPPWAPSAPSAGPNITRTNSVICYSSCDFCSYCHGLALHGGSWVLWIWIFEGSRRWVFSATPLAPLQLGQLSDVVVANFMWIRDCPWFCAFFSQENVEDKKLFRARYWCVFFWFWTPKIEVSLAETDAWWQGIYKTWFGWSTK